MIRSLFLLCLLLLSSSLVLANQEYHSYASLDIQGTLSNPLVVSQNGPQAKISSLTANLTWFPTNNYHQSILEFSTSPSAKLVDGALLFEVPSPSFGAHVFSVDYTVRTTARNTPVYNKVPFPLSSVDSSLVLYTQPAEIININDDIRLLAYELSVGEDDLFIVVTNLARWVHQNVEYDLSTLNVEASLPSSQVLKSRQGVCDEITNLFISLARSLGIPARFVSGLSYTTSELFTENWGAHGWAEVYFPGVGWVPYDVTYGQYGWVDATHVAFAATSDSGKFASSYAWLGHNVRVTPSGMEFETSIVDTHARLSPAVNLQAASIEREVGPHSYNVVMVTVSNPHSFYVAEEVVLGQTQGLETIDAHRQLVVLPPRGSKNVFWRVKVSQVIEQGYQYTYPVLVYSSFNSSSQAEFVVGMNEQVYSSSWAVQFVEELSSGTIKPYSHAVTLDCNSDSLRPRPLERIVITCTVTNNADRSFYDMRLCREDVCKAVDLSVQGVDTVNFSVMFSDQALHTIPFVLRHELLEKQSLVHVHVLGQPSVSIENLSAPQRVDYRDSGVLHFEIVAQNTPLRTVVSVQGRGIDRNWEFAQLTDRKSFDITITGDVLFDLENEYVVKAEYADDRGGSYVETQTIVVEQGYASWWEQALRFFVQLVSR